jgi:PAS domain S-box-containing protein
LERRVEERTAELDRFFTLSLDMLCISSADGYFKRISPAFTQTLGWSVEEILARPFLDFVHPDDHPATLLEVEKQIAAGEGVLNFENRYRHKDGSWRWLSWKSMPQPGGLMYASARDVTERKQAEETIVQLNAELSARAAQLEATNKELESFAYSVSHDLRAPLRGMDGFSQALLEDYAGQIDATGQDYLRRIRAGAQRMGQLIDDLLNLSRVTRSEMVAELVDLTALAHKVITELRSQQAGRAVEWEVSDPLTAHGDPRLLHLVLEKLLANALKFTGNCKDARIEFGQAAQGAEQVFFVRDNGAGFDMAYANRLFGAFQRLHSPLEFPGTGIGLATAQRIIHRHGGRVWAEAQPGKGATFSFTLETAN